MTPYDQNLYNNRGTAKFDLNDIEGAKKDWRKSLALGEPKDDYGYVNSGIIKERLEDYYGAISDYTKAIKLLQSYPYSYVFWLYKKIS